MPVLERVVTMTGMAVRRYSDQAWRAEAVAQLDQTLRDWLLAGAPGSDHQLAYAHALADVATSDPSLDLLAGLLGGSASIDGLAVYTELRWRLLHRLLRRRVPRPQEIQAQPAPGPPQPGRRHTAVFH